MINLVAIQNYIEPYEVSDGKLELLLLEQGLQPTSAYNVTLNKATMYKAVINALTGLLPLKKESDHGSTLEYDTNALKELINKYRSELGENPIARPQNRDISRKW